MPISGLNRKIKINGHGTVPLKKLETVEDHIHVEPARSFIAKDENLLPGDDDTLTRPRLDSDASTGTMQLHLSKSPHAEELPQYPLADTLALLLVLINFPNALITATYVLFSYKEYLAAQGLNIIPSQLPFYLVVLVDLALVLLTAVTLPALRTTITDISYIVVAISLSGAKYRAALPFVLTLPALRGLWEHVRLATTWNDNTANVPLALDALSSRSLSHTIRTIKLHALGDTGTKASSHSMEFLKSAIAIHVCSLGILRLANYWTMSNCASGPEMIKHKKRSYFSDTKRMSGLVSVWDQLLKLRADVVGKRHELTLPGPGDHHAKLWLTEVSVRQVLFTVRTDDHRKPKVVVRLNGLNWDVKLSPVEPAEAKLDYANEVSQVSDWHVLFDNLSAKTEYDFHLEIEYSTSTESHEFAVCTSTSDTATKQVRGDTQALPPIATSLPENSPEKTDDYISGPLSPITTLEDSITNASARLEEQKQLLRRTRKDNSKRIQQLQRDLEYLGPKTNATAEKNEQRLQGRMLSLQTEIKRAQDQIDDMDREKCQVTETIAEQCVIWTKEKAKRDGEAAMLDDVRLTYDIEKEQHMKRLSAVEAEALRIKLKADKLSIKRTKIQQDLDRLSVEQDDILKQEFLQRSETRDAVNRQRLQAEAEYLKIIHEIQQRAELLELYGAS